MARAPTAPKKPAAPKSTAPMAAGPVPQHQPSDDERKWAFAAHLGALVAGALAPLVTMTKRKDSPWVCMHSRESLNFQLTMHCVELAGLILTVVGVGGLIFLLAWGVSVILSVFAGARAWNGDAPKYPFSIKFLKA